MKELQNLLAVVESLLTGTLQPGRDRSNLQQNFPHLAAEIKNALSSCRAQQIDSLLAQLDRLVTAFAGKGKDSPLGYEHYSIELGLKWNELRKLSLEQAVAPAWKSGTLRDNFRNLAGTLRLIRKSATADLLRKVDNSLALLSGIEITFSNAPQRLRNISTGKERELVQNFSALSEHLTDISRALLGSGHTSARLQRSLMVQQWNAIVHQVGEVMMRVYRARTGKSVLATSREGIARIEI